MLAVVCISTEESKPHPSGVILMFSSFYLVDFFFIFRGGRGGRSMGAMEQEVGMEGTTNWSPFNCVNVSGF